MRVPQAMEATVITFRGWVCASVGVVVIAALSLSVGACGQSKLGPVDPGVRGGPAGGGGPLKGLTADETAVFQDGQTRVGEVDGVRKGRGPRFNANQCWFVQRARAGGG